MSGLKARLQRNKEAKRHKQQLQSREGLVKGPEGVLIGPATLLCGEDEAYWTCDEYTIMVRIRGAGGGLGT